MKKFTVSASLIVLIILSLVSCTGMNSNSVDGADVVTLMEDHERQVNELVEQNQALAKRNEELASALKESKKVSEKKVDEAQIEPTPEVDANTIVIKLGKERSLRRIVDELLRGGKILDKDITAGHLRGGGEYTLETWVIRDVDGDHHVVKIENGIIDSIDPYEGKIRDTGFKAITER